MQSLWMLLACLLFSLMGVCVKLASADYSTSEIILYRGLIGVAVMWSVARAGGIRLRSRMWRQHTSRGAVGVTALWLWFFSIGQLSLAMAMTLNYMSPLWLACMLLWPIRHKVSIAAQWPLLLAILTGFLGVILLLHPTLHSGETAGALIALGSGVLSAMAYRKVREMGVLGEPEVRVVFYFSLSCVLAAWLTQTGSNTMAGTHWHTPDLHGWFWLAATGILAVIAQTAMTRAYRLGQPLVVASLQYAGIVFSSLWDILIWKKPLPTLSLFGIALILASGLGAVYYNDKQKHAVLE